MRKHWLVTNKNVSYVLYQEKKPARGVEVKEGQLLYEDDEDLADVYPFISRQSLSEDSQEETEVFNRAKKKAAAESAVVKPKPVAPVKPKPAPVPEVKTSIQPGDKPASASEVHEDYTVVLTKKQLSIKAATDVQIELGGDVRDSSFKLVAGKTTNRKLTDEGNGFVTVNGRKLEIPAE